MLCFTLIACLLVSLWFGLVVSGLLSCLLALHFFARFALSAWFALFFLFVLPRYAMLNQLLRLALPLMFAWLGLVGKLSNLLLSILRDFEENLIAKQR